MWTPVNLSHIATHGARNNLRASSGKAESPSKRAATHHTCALLIRVHLPPRLCYISSPTLHSRSHAAYWNSVVRILRIICDQIFLSGLILAL